MHQKHLEAKHPIYASGNVLVSIRHQDVIAVVNWDEKRLVWMWGRGQISGPHDASVLENGHIMVYDNGLGRGWSRVVELDPVSEEIVWEYQAPNPEDFFSRSRGSNQRFPNGNTLIANSDNGQLMEVTSDGDIVWEFLNPHLNQEGHRATIVKTKRYELSFIDELRGGARTE
jgi:outer membrane protein assembly factor BamB